MHRAPQMRKPSLIGPHAGWAGLRPPQPVSSPAVSAKHRSSVVRGADVQVSYEMRRVIKIIGKNGWATPEKCKCGYRTFMALESRGLISVITTFGSIAFPRKAEASLTDAGKALIGR